MQSYDARTIEKLKIYGKKKWREKKKRKTMENAEKHIHVSHL